MIVEEIAKYLHDSNFGIYDPDGTSSNGEGNIFLEDMPDVQDSESDIAIGLFSSGGQTPDIMTSISRPAVQIIVRGGRDSSDASSLAEQIHNDLHGKTTFYFTPGGTRIMQCACRQSEPIRLGADEQGRMEFSINLMLITGGD